MGVAVMGVGLCGFTPTSTGLSYREMIAKAAKMAYNDAGIGIDQIDGAVSVEEDLISGYSIADEYVPDQLGVVRKPVYTIPGDFLHGLASAVMQIRTGRFGIVVVECYSKASNILTKDELLRFAFDPIFNRFDVSPHFLAGIELQSFLAASDYDLEDVAEVVVKNRSNALSNPLAPYGGDYTIDGVLDARPVAAPLTDQMIARHADGSVVVVLGTDELAREYARKPVFIASTGWGSATSILERRDHSVSAGTQIAAEMAYEAAGVGTPAEEIDAFFVSDLYAHRELMHMEALQVNGDDAVVVNPAGGSLGGGDLFEETAEHASPKPSRSFAARRGLARWKPSGFSFRDGAVSRRIPAP
ncbi:MAG: acetyl-CoA acetyltransferase [Deltaproteobacteria bacterium]|nr:acetyl-CoA acetyltransferase [Deltaproteobacteria bacterium]